jgi:hypothetical protein
MGISGLLPVLANIMESKHVSVYRGMKVAVDTVSLITNVLNSGFFLGLSVFLSSRRQYGWLHRGAYSCSLELCTGAPTDKCVRELYLSYNLPSSLLLTFLNCMVSRYINYCVDRVKMLQFHG